MNFPPDRVRVTETLSNFQSSFAFKEINKKIIFFMYKVIEI